MTTTPNEPVEDPQVVPSGDPGVAPDVDPTEPNIPGEPPDVADPDAVPESM